MKKYKQLYHLSSVNHNNEVFVPRVPKNVYVDEHGYIMEDEKTKRICFSQYISRAYLAMSFDGEYEELYVHVPIIPITDKCLVKPSIKQCPDANFTSEIWVIRPVKMKCIGKVGLSYNQDYDKRSRWRPKVRMKWIERYEEI